MLKAFWKATTWKPNKSRRQSKEIETETGNEISLINVTTFSENCVNSSEFYKNRYSENYKYDVELVHIDESKPNSPKVSAVKLPKKSSKSNGCEKKIEIKKISLIPKPKSSFIRFSSLRSSKKKFRSSSIVVQSALTENIEKPQIRLSRCQSNECTLNDNRKESDVEHEFRRARAAVSVYVLDHLMAAKRIEILENIYGGKDRAHWAAQTIQRRFRKHLEEKNSNENGETKHSNQNLPKNSKSRNNSDRFSYVESVDSEKRKIKTSFKNTIDFDPDDPFDTEKDPERNRLMKLGINIFNRNCNKGIKFLIEHKILEEDAQSIVKFFKLNGLSSYAKGDYLSQDYSDLALQTRRCFIADISFHNLPLEKSIRKLFSFVRIPGETQKILNMLEDFRDVYLAHNSEFEQQLKNPDSVVLMAFTILMLHTSLFNPSAKKQDRMSKEQYISIFKNINDETFFTEEYLTKTYDHIKKKQMKPLSDHTDTVRHIFQYLTGPLLPKDLIQNHRRLVCQFNFNEIVNITKKAGNHVHNRDLFLFNDLLLITKKNNNCEYNIRYSIPLTVMELNNFQTQYYTFGLEIRRNDCSKFILYLNCFTSESRQKFLTDANEYIAQERDFVNLNKNNKADLDTNSEVER